MGWPSHFRRSGFTDPIEYISHVLRRTRIMRSITPSRWAVLLLIVALCSAHLSSARVLDATYDKPAGAARTLSGFLDDFKCVAFDNHRKHYSGNHCGVHAAHCIGFHHADGSKTCCCKT